MVRNHNSSPVIFNINKLNKCKAAKGMSTFDFATLYIKTSHDKLLHVLNQINDFAFKGQDIMLLLLVQEHFGCGHK